MVAGVTPPRSRLDESEGGFDGSSAPARPSTSVGLRVRELVEFAGFYATAQLDRVKLTVQSLLMFVVLGLVAAFVGVAVVFTAGVLLVIGFAEALSSLFGGRVWLGDLITAVLILGTIVVATVVVFKKIVMASRKRLVATYEQRKHEQRTSFGTDVAEQSHS